MFLIWWVLINIKSLFNYYKKYTTIYLYEIQTSFLRIKTKIQPCLDRPLEYSKLKPQLGKKITPRKENRGVCLNTIYKLKI